MYLALILYGSHARGDQRMKSDVDILAITAKGLIDKNKPKRGVSLHEYPLDYLIEKAETGNLFLLHIVSEGVPLSDPLKLHSKLKESFVYKTSYEKEKKEAAAILWFCRAFKTEANEERLRKRIIWSLRTLIISDAAEHGKAVFSSRMLEEYSDILGLKSIIDNRNTISLEKLFSVSRTVLVKYHKQVIPRNWKHLPTVIKWMRAKGKLAAQTPSYIGVSQEDADERAFYT